MAQLTVLLLLLIVFAVTVLSSDGMKKRNSLPEAILKSVEQARTFLRDRKSLNKLSRKRDFEFDEMEEIVGLEEMEESRGRSRISNSVNPNRGLGRSSGRYSASYSGRYPYRPYRPSNRFKFRTRPRNNFPLELF